MGKAEIKLYEAISSGMTTARDFAPDFEYALAGAVNAGDGKKKFLLSTKGSTVLKTETVTQPGSIVRYESFVTGKCIGSILLNFLARFNFSRDFDKSQVFDSNVPRVNNMRST